MIITKRNYNRPEYGDDADILKVSDNFTTEELQLDAINGATWGGYVDLDTDVVEIDKIYIDKRDSKQWLMLSSGNFNAVSKLELSLSNLLEITSKLKPRYSISCTQSGANYNIELSETRMPYVLEKIVLEFNATNIGNDTATISNGISPIIYQLKKQDNLGNVIPVIAGDIVIGTAYAGTFGMNDDIILAIQSFNVTSTTDGITVANGKDLTLELEDNLTSNSITKAPTARQVKKLNEEKEKKVYRELPELGLSSPSTCVQIINALPIRSSCIINEGGSGAIISDVPGVYGILIIDKDDTSAYIKIEWKEAESERSWLGKFLTASNTLVWVEIMTSDTPTVPVGGILVMADNTSPTDKYPGTTWSIQIDGRFVMGGNQSTVNATGGSNTKTISVANLPAHNFTRGTQEIQGDYSFDVEGTQGIIAGGTGVFGKYPNTFPSAGVATSPTSNTENARAMDFVASRNWTGASSSVGSGTALDITPAYTKLVLWKRLS